MKLKNILKEKKKYIVDQWVDSVIKTYPVDTSHFFKREKDAFANPVGITIIAGLKGVFEQLYSEMDTKTINSFLDPIIRIRAVQNFSSSSAVSFIFFLKKIIRKSLKKELFLNNIIVEELLLVESKIDEVALIAFEIYVKCREKLSDIKANEVKNITYNALERAGLVGATSQNLKGTG